MEVWSVLGLLAPWPAARPCAINKQKKREREKQGNKMIVNILSNGNRMQ